MIHQRVSAAIRRLLAATLAVLMTGTCVAATFTVDSTIDSNDLFLGDGICSDGAGHCTLRAAVQEADVTPPGSVDTINVPPGTYVTTAILGSTKSDPAKNFSITGTGALGSVIIDGSGGTPHGIFLLNGAGITNLNNLVIQNGSAASGGGIAIIQGTINVSLSLITNNQASAGGNTGGIYVYSADAVLNLDRSTVSNNTSPNDAGGIRIVGGAAHISNSAIINNHANLSFGGGGGVENQSTLTIVNSTISGNTAKIAGAISSFGSVMTQLSNVTIAANSFPQVYADAPTTLVSSIVANPLGGGVVNCSGAFISSLGHNIDSGASCGFNSASDQKNTNPMLAPLANNGGTTLTHALLLGSPALDMGANPLGLNTDQRGTGFPRASGVNIDIGAFEGVQVDRIFADGFGIPNF